VIINEAAPTTAALLITISVTHSSLLFFYGIIQIIDLAAS